MGLFSSDTITDFVRLGDLDGVRRRLELGDDVNERRSFNYTPLMEAARLGYCAIVDLLVDHGADMELVNSNRSTALHAAIDKVKVDAALLLARRGACANKIGFLGLTPLQSAIENDLLQVTMELLAHGADPMIRSESGKVAKDFIPYGPSREEFKHLLNAYTDLDCAIRWRNPAAIAACLNRTLTGDTAVTISSIDAAIQLKTQAVTEDSDFRETLVHIAETHLNNLLEPVLLSQDIDALKKLVQEIGNPAWIQEKRFSNGWTALHYAASLDNYDIVHYLLVDCGLNPLVASADDKTAHEVAISTNVNSTIGLLLQQHTKKTVFYDQTALLMCTDELTVDDLRGLIRQITSVKDLRFIVSFGFQSFSNEEMHSVLTEAFDAVIREKLVFDDRAAVFFKVGLHECRRQNCISEVELIEWDLKATKVNMENSDWVRDIKLSVQGIEGRVATYERSGEMLRTQFDRLRDALIQRERSEIKQRERQRSVSYLSLALTLCGGSFFTGLLEAAFDSSDPAQLLSALSEDGAADFLAEKTSTVTFKDGLEAVLADASVDPAEFAIVLRGAVSRRNAETAQTESEEGRENVIPVDRYPDDSTVRAAGEDSFALNGISDENLEAYPYHYAVKFSDGDVDRFQELVQYIDKDDGHINETLTICVRPNGSSNKWEEVLGSAVIYASYLGYVEIVKWFYEHDAVKVTEKKFSTMKRSHSSSKNINDVCIKKPVSGVLGTTTSA